MQESVYFVETNLYISLFMEFIIYGIRRVKSGNYMVTVFSRVVLRSCEFSVDTR